MLGDTHMSPSIPEDFTGHYLGHLKGALVDPKKILAYPPANGAPTEKTRGTKTATIQLVRFTEGEYVEVSGTRADMSFCQQGTGTVDVNRIREVPS